MLIFDFVKSPGDNSSFTAQELSKNVENQTEDEILGDLVKSFTDVRCSPSEEILRARDFLISFENVARNEDDIGRYVTILKILIRKLSPDILYQLYDSETNEFPIFQKLLQYSLYEDIMIKNAARLSLLAVFKESRGDVKNYVVQYGIPKHSTNIASLLKCIIFDFQDSVEKEQEDCARSAYFQFQEEIEYIDDVLNLKMT
ncbi:FPL domain-containing protein [Caerostris darwini]|uniref:FPL domain-containing protein n=1 Tax=Caerostris darwini TaxID=1538125 RepID=A0AAV4R5W6_9ARAC|nr:FPL domain-containing protein [Caerostris darwini]